MIRFQALGAVTVMSGTDEVSLGGGRQRRLVAMLLIHRNEVVSVDRLAEAVFAGEPTAAASTTLRSYVARVRKALENDAPPGPRVVTRAPGYVLQVQPEGFDVAQFEAGVARGPVLLARGEAFAAAATLTEALALWRGDPYAEFADEEWAMSEAQRLGELRLVASERLIEAGMACGRAAEHLPDIEALTRAHPLRELFRVQLMTAYYRSGRQADALRVMREFREELADELGIDPSPELVGLEQRILRQDPALQLSEPAGRPLRGYLLGERLGTGRDGVVHAARLPEVDREFVVRTFRADMADDPDFVRAFEKTAHQVASLRHPGVVPVHDYWREPGAAYVVMLRMPGGTLRDRLRRGPLSPGEVHSLVERIGGALVAAEEAGVRHGRVTAESVLLDRSGQPCLSDFWLGDPGRLPTPNDDVEQFLELLTECSGVRLDARGIDRFADLLPWLRTSLASPSSGSGSDTGSELPNPYQGLRAFDETDAADFFGRAELVEAVLGRLTTQTLGGRIIIVVGASGTGKSSVVRAGVLPRVRAGAVPGSEDWFVTTMLPGGAPFKELAESLRRVAVGETDGLAEELAKDHAGIDRVLRRIVPDGSQLLLVLDQFEELFTLSPAQEQRAFLDGLTYAALADDSRLRLVTTLRADYYDRPLAFQPFGDLVSQATVTITAMLPSDVEAAIVEPARRVGREVERALAAELVSALAKEPSALPSLQFALYELAESSPDGRLTQAAYHELGGIDGAIAWRAEQLYQSLLEPERDQVRSLFERLVLVGPEGEATRRRAARTELVGDRGGSSIDEAIARWAGARLLTLDVHPQTRLPTVELAHEALVREWPRLRGWIEEDRDAIIVRGRLREAAETWAELGREPTALYRGTTLEAALSSTAGRSDLPDLEREYLEESAAARERELQREAQVIEYQARTNKRLRRQLAFIGAALVLALVGGFVAVDQRRDAVRERHVAVARELAAAADSALREDPERSILLALAAIDATRAHGEAVLPEAQEALHRGVTSSRVVLSVPNTGGQLDWSADGKYFATEGVEETGIVDIRDGRTGKTVRAFKGHDIDVNDVSFSADSKLLATTGDDSLLKVWDVATGELRVSHQGEGAAWGAALSPDGSLASASWGDRGVVRVIRVPSGEVVSTIRGDEPHATSFSTDGKRVAVTFAGEQRVAVFDARTGRKEVDLDESAEGQREVAWSPDGRSIAIATSDASAQVFDARTGAFRFATAGHVAAVNSIDWSSDSGLLATASDDGTVRIHEITPQGARELLTLSSQDQRNGVRGVAFSADDSQLMTSDWKITSTKIWDISETGAAEWGNVSGEFGRWYALSFAPDGKSVYHPTGEGTYVRADYATGTTLQAFGPAPGETEFGWPQLALSPDGKLLATPGADFPVHVWDTSTGELLFDVAGDAAEEPFAWVPGMDWSADSKTLALAINSDAGARVETYDTAGKRQNVIAEEGDIGIGSVSLSPDGRHVATTRLSPRDDPNIWGVRIWDAKTDKLVREIKTPARNAVYAESGDRLVTARYIEGVGEVWNARTGKKISTLIGHAALIESASFNSDGTTVATGSADGSVRIWDADTGLFKAVLRGPTPAGIASVVVSPDDTRLASSSYDGLTRVWALDLDDLIRMAKDRLTRGLTPAECRQYLHVDRCPGP